MLLDSTVKILQVVLGGVVTTNELPIVVHFDTGIVNANLVGFSFTAFTNGTTDVNIISSPTNKERKTVRFLSIRNADTVSATVTLKLEDNGTGFEILKVVLAVDDTLIYTDEHGFNVITSTGAIKGAGGGGGGGGLTLTTKGDLHTFDTGDVALPVGADGEVLTVDSAEATGLKYAGAASGGEDFGAKVQSSVNQSILNNAWTELDFEQEQYDTDTLHDNVTLNQRIQLPGSSAGDGRYICTGVVQFAANATGQRGLRINVNGNSVQATTFVDAAAADTTRLNVSIVLDLEDNQFVVLEAFQNSGGALNSVADSTTRPSLSLHRLAIPGA